MLYGMMFVHDKNVTTFVMKRMSDDTVVSFVILLKAQERGTPGEKGARDAPRKK